MAIEKIKILGAVLELLGLTVPIDRYQLEECTLPKNDLLSHLNWGAQVSLKISLNE